MSRHCSGALFQRPAGVELRRGPLLYDASADWRPTGAVGEILTSRVASFRCALPHGGETVTA